MAAPADIFVGRLGELAVLREALDAAVAGRGGVALLAGEPGIGKTRTAQELALYAGQIGAAVLWGRCHEESGAPPYWLWVQVIRGALRLPEAVELLTAAGPAASDIADMVPEVRALLPGLEPSVPLDDAGAARFRMFEAIRQLFDTLCQRQPVLLVLDDLHWADAPSLRLLEFLAPELATQRMLLVGPYRPTELSRRHPLSDTLGELARTPRLVRIDLTGLSTEEVHEFLAATGRNPTGLLAASLQTQTEGNPLFLREIVRFLEQQGSFGGQEVIRVPEGVTAVIGRRLNLLSAACNEMLAVASVIGRDFAHDVLVCTARWPSEAALVEALDEALGAAVIEETADHRYQFRHNLIRMTLYDELRPARRRELHRDVGDAIETLRRADLDAVSPELAHHFRAAGDLDRAIDYATRAGQRAMELLAFEDAAQSFQAALDSAAQRAEPDEPLRCRLLFLLGEAKRKADDYASALQNLLMAANAASALGEQELFARAALVYEQVAWRGGIRADPPPTHLLERALEGLSDAQAVLRAQLAGGLARALRHEGEFAEGRAQGERAVAMARQLGDPATLAMNLVYMLDAAWTTNHTDEHIDGATEMLAAAEQAGNMEIVGMAYGWRLCMRLEFGDVRAAEADLHALTRVDTRIGQRTYSIGMLAFHFMLSLMRGELAEAERRIVALTKLQRRELTAHADQLSVMIFSLRREQGRLGEIRPMLALFLHQRPASKTWLPGLALIHVELGQLDEARAEFEQLASDGFARLVHDGRWYYNMVYLSEVCAALGDADRAATLYRMLEPFTGRNLVLGGGLVCCGSADRYLGILATTMSQWADAEPHFEQALAMNQAIEADAPLAHTRYDYATMLLARDAPGDKERAIDLLRLSLERARAMGMRALEERAAARLAQVAPQQPDSVYADYLTVREIEVLKLLAIGRSNADIALVLEISHNTVASHVRNILTKTGCANRTEAAAYAMRHGLAPSHHS